jgi:hypothetical protein
MVAVTASRFAAFIENLKHIAEEARGESRVGNLRTVTRAATQQRALAALETSNASCHF